MTKEEIISYIGSKYPNQLVLYTGQLAALLGKSPKALSHLVGRGRLPIDYVKIGGRYCVDIFQVADFLAGLSESSVGVEPVKNSKSVVGKSKKSITKNSRISLAPRLAQMRIEAVTAMRRIRTRGWSESFKDAFSVELLLLNSQLVRDEEWGVFVSEVPPLNSAKGNLVKSVFEKENGLEEAVFRRADHRIFEAGGSWRAGEGIVSSAWIQ